MIDDDNIDELSFDDDDTEILDDNLEAVLGKRKRYVEHPDNNESGVARNKRKPRHYIKNWVATIQMEDDDIEESFKNKFQEYLDFLHKNTSLLYGCGGLETSPTTSKNHFQCVFYFNLRVYESTLRSWMNKCHMYGYLKPCKDIEGSFFYTRKENNFMEIGDYSKVKFQGKRSDIENVFQMISEKGFKETLKSNPTGINKCLKTAQLYEQVLVKKRPPNKKKVWWICGDSGTGKSLLARFMSEKILKNDEQEPNFYTETGSERKFFCEFNFSMPITVMDNIQIRNESDFTFILGIVFHYYFK
jgi:hypothetical protein